MLIESGRVIAFAFHFDNKSNEIKVEGIKSMELCRAGLNVKDGTGCSRR